jgi:hypothetical protein
MIVLANTPRAGKTTAAAAMRHIGNVRQSAGFGVLGDAFKDFGHPHTGAQRSNQLRSVGVERPMGPPA